MGRDELWGSRPRLSGAETSSADGALTTGHEKCGSGLDLAEAERCVVCGWQLAEWEIFYFMRQCVVSNICDGCNKWTT